MGKERQLPPLVGGISNPELHPHRRHTDPQEGQEPAPYSYSMEQMIAVSEKTWDAIRLAQRIREAPLVGLAEAIFALTPAQTQELERLIMEAYG